MSKVSISVLENLPRLQQKALKRFNMLVASYTTYSVLPARLNALHELRQGYENKEVLALVVDYFLTRMAHWSLDGGDKFKNCVYILKRLSVGCDDFTRRASIDYAGFVVVSIGGRRTAVIEKRRERKFCKMHPKARGSSEGWCQTCIRKFTKMSDAGFVLDRVPKEVIERILNLPTYRGRYAKISFISDCRKILQEENLL